MQGNLERSGQNYQEDEDKEARAQKDRLHPRAAQTLPTSRFPRRRTIKEKKRERSGTWEAVNVCIMNHREAAE